MGVTFRQTQPFPLATRVVVHEASGQAITNSGRRGVYLSFTAGRPICVRVLGYMSDLLERDTLYRAGKQQGGLHVTPLPRGTQGRLVVSAPTPRTHFPPVPGDFSLFSPGIFRACPFSLHPNFTTLDRTDITGPLQPSLPHLPSPVPLSSLPGPWFSLSTCHPTPPPVLRLMSSEPDLGFPAPCP